MQKQREKSEAEEHKFGPKTEAGSLGSPLWAADRTRARLRAVLRALRRPPGEAQELQADLQHADPRRAGTPGR